MKRTFQLLFVLAMFIVSLVGCTSGANGGTVKVDKDQVKATRLRKQEKG